MFFLFELLHLYVLYVIGLTFTTTSTEALTAGGHHLECENIELKLEMFSLLECWCSVMSKTLRSFGFVTADETE